MEACHEQIDQLRRDERQREREKSREISEQLKKLCDGGTCSMDDIEAKRKEFTRELEEMRRSSEVSVRGERERGGDDGKRERNAQENYITHSLSTLARTVLLPSCHQKHFSWS